MSKQGVFPSIIDLIALYYEKNKVITQEKEQRPHQ